MEGREHNAAMSAETHLLDMLLKISEEQLEGVDFSGFGYSLYPLHLYMQCVLMQQILKAPLRGSFKLSRLQPRYKVLIACFHIVIKNCFPESSKCWALLQHRHNF